MHIINPRKTTTLIAYVRSEHDLLNEPSVMPEEERACFCLPMLLSNGGSITECFYLTGQTRVSQLGEWWSLTLVVRRSVVKSSFCKIISCWADRRVVTVVFSTLRKLFFSKKEPKTPLGFCDGPSGERETLFCGNCRINHYQQPYGAENKFHRAVCEGNLKVALRLLAKEGF